jgi:uncharacterized membrane protein
MAAPLVFKATKRIGWLLVLVLVSVATAWIVGDRSVTAVVIAFTFALGIPVLLLLLIDLGRALRVERDGDFRATRTTWLLAHLQAALGALCMAVGGFSVIHRVSLWLTGTANFNGVMLLIWIPIGIGMVVVGFSYIWSAFTRDRKDEPSEK